MKTLRVLVLSLCAMTGSAALASESALPVTTGAITDIGENAKQHSGSNVLTRDALYERLINQESRGNQFGRNGQPLTSVKGAVGIAQIMPETAPEAAMLAGLEWSHWRYRNDATYNMALGRAYLDSQLERYDGNHILALAAYNAGPGRVDKWVKRFGDPRTGEISNDEFISLIPISETQEYVATILNGAPTKYAYSSTRKKAATTSGTQFEFKDTHPGFSFSVAVSRTFDSHSKLVGGL